MFKNTMMYIIIYYIHISSYINKLYSKKVFILKIILFNNK